MKESHDADDPDQLFLSCLFGSEEFSRTRRLSKRFLSCLFGSEAMKEAGFALPKFLSCLFGSEEIADAFCLLR